MKRLKIVDVDVSNHEDDDYVIIKTTKKLDCGNKYLNSNKLFNEQFLEMLTEHSKNIMKELAPIDLQMFYYEQDDKELVMTTYLLK